MLLPASLIAPTTFVDLARQLDEFGGLLVLAGLPGQVERVDGYAVPAQPGPRVERLEAERFRAGGRDHLPDVYAHRVEDHLQLVDQGDVHATVDVLDDLGRLGDLARRDRDRLFDHGRIEGMRHGQTLRAHSPDKLRSGACRVVLAARILALGGERQPEILLNLQAGLLQDRQHDLPCRSRVRGGLQRDQLAGSQGLGNGPGRAFDVLQIGVLGPRQRRRHADDDRVRLPQPRHVVRRREPARPDHLPNHRGRDVLDVTAAGVQSPDLRRVHVEAGDPETGVTELAYQRQADVAQAYHPDVGLPPPNAFQHGPIVAALHVRARLLVRRTGPRGGVALALVLRWR